MISHPHQASLSSEYLEIRHILRVNMECTQCSARSCVLVKTKNVCLRHFVSLMAGDKTDAFVFNVDEVANQAIGVKRLWDDAIGEVALRMFELQKKEEETLRKDPLSILTMNKMTTKKALQQQFGEASDFLKSLPQEQPTRKSSSTSVDSGNSKRGFFLLTDHQEHLARQMDEIEKKSRANADGDACRVCGSNWTTTTYSAHYDIGKSEVWGNKDAGETLVIICRECHHREIIKK